MSRVSYKRDNDPLEIKSYLGVYKRKLSLFEAVALIVSGTIGAGILGLPFAVSKVGIFVGALYIISLGLLVMGLHLLIGEVVARTGGSYQLVGIARKYLGKWGGVLMTGLLYTMLLGVLVVYIIGEGHTLATLFGGDPTFWSTIFFVIAAGLVLGGLRTVKVVDFVLALFIIGIIVVIALWSAPHVQAQALTYTDLAHLFFPYGVVLFAFHGINTIPEAHELLKKRDTDFKKAIIIAGCITIVAYLIFALSIVGVTGTQTTEVATIGLGNALGKHMFLFGNIFAVIAMGTSYTVSALALRDSLRWDYNIPTGAAGMLATGVPFLLFVLGLRSFIMVLDIIGGVFISLEMLLALLIYYKAKHAGDLKRSKYNMHYSVFVLMLMIIAFAVGAIYSVHKLL